MPAAARRAEQAPDLLAAEDVGEALRLRGRGNAEGGALPPQRDVVQEAKAVRRDVARAPGEMALLDQMQQIGLHLAICQLRRGAMVEPRQQAHGPHVGLPGARGHAPHDHVVLHACS